MRELRAGRLGNRRGERNRAGAWPRIRGSGPAAAMLAEITRRIETGLDPPNVAERVLSAVRQNELYVFTHPEMRSELEDRFAAMLRAMDQAGEYQGQKMRKLTLARTAL
jgi:hypothetical protein